MPLGEENLELVAGFLKNAFKGEQSVSGRKLYLHLDTVPAPELGYQLKTIFDRHPGGDNLFLLINGKEYPTKSKLNYNDALLLEVSALLGGDYLVLKV